MSAATTTETVSAPVLRHQVDRLGYTLCRDCADPARGGDTYQQETRDVLRSAETDDRGLWTCAGCHRYVTEWPVDVAAFSVVVEHTVCRIF